MGSTEPIAAFLEPRHFELAEKLTEFTRSELLSLEFPEDDQAGRRQARELLSLLGKAGLLRHVVLPEHGGVPTAPDFRAACLIRETLAAFSPLADAVFALQALGSQPIANAGTEAQKATWLPRVAAGEAMAAFAMTEPEAGSDVGGMSTEATTTADGFVLNGTKTLISNAGLADFYCVLALTDPKADRQRISFFLVPADTPGLRFVRPLIMSAPHPLGEISFEGCRLPSHALVGPLGSGLRTGLATLDRLRPTVAAAAGGMAQRALTLALDHAKTRHQFGAPLAELPIIQDKLAQMAMEITTSRLITFRAAWEADRGKERITVEAAMAKAHATEAAQRVVDQAIQILGGTGVLAHHPIDHLYRSVRALRIYEGSTEVQHLVIARHLLAAR
ncbi:MAG: acyl-CoA dehydrogenase family protein [Thermoanaerobaculia bacterium]|nr:acyl-CoA dehydrogenase family protein [Thermoanaerobaculia bacterium]